MLFSYKIFRLPPYFLYDVKRAFWCTLYSGIGNICCQPILLEGHENCSVFLAHANISAKCRPYTKHSNVTEYSTCLYWQLNEIFDHCCFSLRNQMYPDHFNRLQHFLQSKFENFDFGLWYINSRTINSE